MHEAALDLYLARIGLGAPAANAAGLSLMQAAHRRAIAFENADIALGRTIAIDASSVFDKLVTRRRGGYCFEHNRLFADMLALLGLRSRPLLARVRLGAAPNDTPPRTHVLLLADIAGDAWLADAGFGMADLPPLALVDGARAGGFRLRRVGSAGAPGGEWLLEQAGDEGFRALYSFDIGAVAPLDLEQANHWTSTRAGTRFTSQLVVTRPQAQGFAMLTGRRLTLRGAGSSETRVIASSADLRAELTDTFGLAFSADEAERLATFG